MKFRFIKYLVTSFLLLLLSACGPTLEGVYEDPVGATRITFKQNGTGYFGLLGFEVEMTYSVDGDRLKLRMQDDNIILRMRDSNTIEGPFGVVYTKK